MRVLAVLALAACAAVAGQMRADAQSIGARGPDRFIEPIPNHLLPGFFRFGRIAVEDRVTGNCWTDTGQAADLLTRRLAEGGIRLLDYEPADRTLAAPIFVLSGMGYRFDGNTCVVSARLLVQSFAGRPTGDFDGERYFMIRQPARVFEMNGVYVNSKTANDAVRGFIEDAARAFLDARDAAMHDPRVAEAVRNDPALISVPLSREEVLRMVGSQ